MSAAWPRQAAKVARAAALVFGTASCGAEPAQLPAPGHVMVHLDTDAPVPPAPGVELAADAPPPLFDRITVDVLRASEPEPCPGCSRDFDLHAGLFAEGGSLAVVPDSPGEDLRIRARMYRIAAAVDGFAPADGTVEVVARLPPAPEQGAVHATVMLPTDAVGRPLGTLEAPVEADPGEPATSRVGTWPGARRVGCADAPGPAEVCIPGGAYWLGNIHAGDGYHLAAAQRLVVVAPFFIDAHEVTVAEFRASGVATPDTVVPWSGDDSGNDLIDWCNYTDAPDPLRDPMALNCVGWNGAQLYCLGRGADLPTEAQFEYVAGGLESRAYAWGQTEPTCIDAVWGQAAEVGPAVSPCDYLIPEGTLGGPVPLVPPPDPVPLFGNGRGAAVLATGVVWDIAGNVTEWSRDLYGYYDEPCWYRPETNVLVDPVCEIVGRQGDERARRGGAWISLAADIRAAWRSSGALGTAEIEVGFRCARPAVPAP